MRGCVCVCVRAFQVQRFGLFSRITTESRDLKCYFNPKAFRTVGEKTRSGSKVGTEPRTFWL